MAGGGCSGMVVQWRGCGAAAARQRAWEPRELLRWPYCAVHGPAAPMAVAHGATGDIEAGATRDVPPSPRPSHTGADAMPPRGRPLPASTPAPATSGVPRAAETRRARSGGDPEHRAPNSLPLPPMRHGRRCLLHLLASVKGPKGKVVGGHFISGCSRFLPFPLSLAARASSWARAGPARWTSRASRPGPA